MKIEIAHTVDSSNKDKGDLLEKLSKKLLESQGYSVIEEIRMTGSELDLLCKHKVSGKEIYVECKAQKEKISAPILRQLLGTVDFNDHNEGWLVATSEFGKEAKGFVEIWSKKPNSSKLSFYTPDIIIQSLIGSSVITEPQYEKAKKFIGSEEFLGDWILFITPYGNFWIVFILEGGIPTGVLVYNATNGRQIEEKDMLINLSTLNTYLKEYDFLVGLNKVDNSSLSFDYKIASVVEVQTGDSWNDYRPARPKDFVGRDKIQDDIFSFFNNVRLNKTDTRIFAINGNSGLGKSSLIAKIREKSKNKFHKKNTFVFAVDIRGAKEPSYIYSSLLNSFKDAQKAGIGINIDLQLTNPSSPLSSPSIVKYLSSLSSTNKILCLVFDQFEELYSKPELFGVFNAAKDLMLDVASSKSNFVLGFAWKTDSTTQQDHPAYHMWHNLSDYRIVYKLDVFTSGEMKKSINKFEKEINQKIANETRNQIVYSSQGFPWLLKKLCINLSESLAKGDDNEFALVDLDVTRLFENDLELLSLQELSCLKIIAQKAPADWSEIIEISSIGVLNNLVHKRLVIKSGDRLNIYWDIFKDYLLTKKVPIIPFNYIPTSDLYSMFRVANCLNSNKYIDINELISDTLFKEKTIGNISADLVMLGIAERKNGSIKFHRDLKNATAEDILEIFRKKFGNHSLKIALYKKFSGKTIMKEDIKDVLKNSFPDSSHSDKTLTTYNNRLINILNSVGYLNKIGNKIIVQDIGSPIFDINKFSSKSSAKSLVFSASTSPSNVCELLDLIKEPKKVEVICNTGYRNALSIVKKFSLIENKEDIISINENAITKFGGIKEAVWTLAKKEPAINFCIEYLNRDTEMKGIVLGKLIAEEFNLNWSNSSLIRNGNSLKQWSLWIKEGIDTSSIPHPYGRENKK